jgi:hypothetical protein
VDELRISIEPQPWKYGSIDGNTIPYGGGAVTVIYINYEPLIELVRRCELPAAHVDGQEGLAGSYKPLWGYRFDPGLFFGRPCDPELRRPDGVVLMGCDCGVVGCWPLECRLGVEGETITWDRFRQPFRPGWDHSALGPFVFDRVAYEREVARAAARFVELVGKSAEQRGNYEERMRVTSIRYPDQDLPDWATVSGTADT